MLLDRVTNKWLDKDNFAKQSTWTSTKTSSSSTDIKYSTKTSSSTSTNLPVSASTSAYTECLNKYILQPFLQVSLSRHAIPMLPPLRLTPPQCLQQRCSRPTTTPAARCLHNAPTHTPLAPKIVATQPSRLCIIRLHAAFALPTLALHSNSAAAPLPSTSPSHRCNAAAHCPQTFPAPPTHTSHPTSPQNHRHAAATTPPTHCTQPPRHPDVAPRWPHAASMPPQRCFPRRCTLPLYCPQGGALGWKKDLRVWRK